MRRERKKEGVTEKTKGNLWREKFCSFFTKRNLLLHVGSTGVSSGQCPPNSTWVLAGLKCYCFKATNAGNQGKAKGWKKVLMGCQVTCSGLVGSSMGFKHPLHGVHNIRYASPAQAPFSAAGLELKTASEKGVAATVYLVKVHAELGLLIWGQVANESSWQNSYHDG